MKELKKEELLNINGGTTISASLLNAASRAITLIINMGRSLGSAIRRTFNGKLCRV